MTPAPAPGNNHGSGRPKRGRIDAVTADRLRRIHECEQQLEALADQRKALRAQIDGCQELMAQTCRELRADDAEQRAVIRLLRRRINDLYDNTLDPRNRP